MTPAEKHMLSQIIVGWTNRNEVVWSDIIDGMRYEAFHDGVMWSAQCCMSGMGARTVSRTKLHSDPKQNHSVILLSGQDAMDVCTAIMNQQQRNSEASVIGREVIKKYEHEL